MTAARRLGRPRSFDRQEALDVALRLFWRWGFDAVSVAELTTAMGITPPSLYAAFGDKKTLFREVVDVYQRTYGAFFLRALKSHPAVRDGVHQALRDAAVEYTDRRHPPGCLVLSAAVNCMAESVDVAELLRRIRAANTQALRQRIQTQGGPVALAPLVGVVLEGMSQHARDGACTRELLDVAETTMLAWPEP
jgi:TetR/AcrR family transcriptional regulator, copper-responsive repressor